ncbi:MAG TPA: lysylphosphatidylglycerol synthase transmembrane domain-containing protein, partial [Candidatus Limnocylindrales bacterium]
TAAPAAAVFIDDAVARGESGPRTAVAMIVVLVVDLVTALPFVLVGAAALIARSTLVEFAVIGTVWFLGFIAVLVLGLVLAARRPSLLERLLGLVSAAVNGLLRRLGRRMRVPDDWARLTTEQMVAGVAAVPRHPGEIAIASGFGLAVHVVNLAGLGALFLAFGQPLDPAALAAGFGMGIVFFIVSIVPDGIGAVEGAMALVFVALGMPPATAILVAIAFRVLNVWIPVGLGFVCARYLRLFGGQGFEGSEARSQPT